jgi:hypothetical protein
MVSRLDTTSGTMGIIPQNDAYLAALRNLVEPEHVLKRHGFTLQLLTEEELLLKRRCLMCGRGAWFLIQELELKLTRGSLVSTCQQEIEAL